MAREQVVAPELHTLTVTGANRVPGALASFTIAVALSAIFVDAAVGHGLTWENDPYWTYWITKTFLIATILGLGTAWFGVGNGRGAVITAIHKLVLTIYYWTLSPIGLPSHPPGSISSTLESPVSRSHFGVIYVGYLLGLWILRRRQTGVRPLDDSRSLGLRSLMFGVGIVVVAGGSAASCHGALARLHRTLDDLLAAGLLMGIFSILGFRHAKKKKVVVTTAEFSAVGTKSLSAPRSGNQRTTKVHGRSSPLASSSPRCSAPVPVTELPTSFHLDQLLPHRRQSRDRRFMTDNRSTPGQGADRTKRYSTVLL